MKIKDLMIGDWVQVDVVKGADLILVKRKVVGITNVKTATVTIDDGVEMFAAFLLPVPLTTEILEKNGFVKVPDRYEYPDCQCWTNDVDGDYSFEIVADEHRKPHILGNREMGDYELVNFECKFVHELQHALKLCGIEKEIEL